MVMGTGRLQCIAQFAGDSIGERMSLPDNVVGQSLFLGSPTVLESLHNPCYKYNLREGGAPVNLVSFRDFLKLLTFILSEF